MKQTVNTIFGDVPIAKRTEWDLVEDYFQPIRALYEDESVTDILISRFDDICVERSGVLERTDACFSSEIALVTFIEQVAKALGQELDANHPMLNARLPDCSRLMCTLAETTPLGATVSMRVVSKKYLLAQDLVEFGALTQDMLDYLIGHIKSASNFIVSGNTGSGKTSLLRALSRYIPDNERVITCEDTLELFLKWLNFGVSMEAPKRKGCNIDMQHLIQGALRMRPDRIWVGEIRHAEATDAFLQAINTGHSAASTIHSNSGEDTIARMQYLVASAGLISYELAAKQILGSVNLLVHASRKPAYGRKVTEISVIEDYKIKPVFIYDVKAGKHIRVSD